MASLSIDPDYVRRLVLKVRSFMGKEATEVPDGAPTRPTTRCHRQRSRKKVTISVARRWWKRSGVLRRANRPSWSH